MCQISATDIKLYGSWSSSKFSIFQAKELCQLHNDYPLAPDKIEIKREMLSDYQVKITDLYKIPIANVKNLMSNFFDKERYVLNYVLYLRIGLKLKKKLHCVLEFKQSQ